MLTRSLDILITNELVEKVDFKPYHYMSNINSQAKVKASCPF